MSRDRLLQRYSRLELEDEGFALTRLLEASGAAGNLPRVLRLRAAHWRRAPALASEVLRELDARLARRDDESALAMRGRLLQAMGYQSDALRDFAASARERGECLAELGRWAEAEKALSRAIRRDPRDAWSLAWRWAVRTNLGRRRDAAADLRRSLDARPGSASLRVLAGEYDHAVDLDPGSLWARVLRGRLRLAEGDAVPAAEDFSAALDARPDCVWLLGLRAAALRAAGDVSGAEADLDRLGVAEYEGAFARLPSARASGLPPYRPIEAPVSWLAAELALLDASRPWQGPRTAALRADLVDSIGGADLIRVYARRFPADAMLRGLWGRIQAYEGRLQPALASLDEAVRLEPRAGWLRAWRAEARRLAGGLDGAALDLAEARRLSPTYNRIPLWEARLWLDRGDKTRALRCLDEAFGALDRPHSTPDSRFVGFLRGRLLLEAGRAAEAERDLWYGAACETDPLRKGEAPLFAKLLGAVRGGSARMTALKAWAAARAGVPSAARPAARDHGAALALAADAAQSIKEGRTARAVTSARTAALACPEAAPFRALFAAALLRSGARPAAVAAQADAFTASQPWSWDTGTLAARCLRVSGKTAAAESRLAAIACVYPREGWPRYELALARLAAGRGKEALSALARAAVPAFPGESPFSGLVDASAFFAADRRAVSRRHGPVVARYWEAALLSDAGRRSEAEALWAGGAPPLLGWSAGLRAWRAASCLDEGRLEEAAFEAEAAAATAAAWPLAVRAWSRLLDGRPGDAAQDAASALAADAGCAEAAVLAALAAWTSGDAASARRMAEAAVETDSRRAQAFLGRVAAARRALPAGAVEAVRSLLLATSGDAARARQTLRALQPAVSEARS